MISHVMNGRRVFKILLAWVAAAGLAAALPGEGRAQRGGGLAAAPAAQGTWRAVVAGVSDYDHLASLDYADDDARAVYDYLVHPQGGGLDTANVEPLFDEDVTVPALIEHLAAFMEKTKEGDRLLFYFAGHGDVVMSQDFEEKAYLLVHDAEKGAYASNLGLSMEALNNVAERVGAQGGQFVIVLDACRSGNVADTKEGARRAAGVFSERDQTIKLVSSQGDQLSWENAEWGGGHGVFTYHLLRGLYGLADQLPQDEALTFLEVQTFVQREVMQATTQPSYGTQTPVGVASDLNATLFGVNEVMLAEAQALEAKGFPTLIASRSAAASRAGAADSTASALLRRFRQALDAGRLLDKPSAPPGAIEAPVADTDPPPDASAWALYGALTGALDPGDVAERDLLRRARGSLAVALQEDAQATLTRYVRGISDAPSSDAFAGAGRATRHTLHLLPADYFMIEDVEAGADFYEGYAIVLRREAARYDEAEALLRKALAADPSGAHVYTALSDLARYRRDFDAALRYAEQALERAPRWEYAHVRRADVLEDMGRYREALGAYGALIEMHPESNYALNNRGVLYHNLDRYAEAERDFKAARALDESGGLYLANLAAVALEREHLNRAEELLTEARERFPDHDNVQEKLGDFYRAAEQGQRAAEHYRRAADLDPYDPRPHNELGNLYRRSDGARALEHFRDAVRIDPAYLWAYDDIAALVAEREGDDAGARVLLDADRALGRPAWTANQLGAFHEHRDRTDEAERRYREAVERNADYVWSYFNLAELFEEQGRPDEAAAWLERAAARFEGNPIPFTRLGAFHFRQQHPQDAARAYRRALRADSSYLPAVSGLAHVDAAAGRYADAARRFARAAEQNPARYHREDFTGTLEARAGAHERAGEPDAALRAWRAARSLASERERPVRGLARLHYLAGRPDNALPLADEALAQLAAHQQSALAQAHTLRALVLLDLDRPDDALDALDAADRLRVYPDRRTRALLLWALGRRDDARALHRQAASQPAPVPYSPAALSLERLIDP